MILYRIKNIVFLKMREPSTEKKIEEIKATKVMISHWYYYYNTKQSPCIKLFWNEMKLLKQVHRTLIR